jgi:hypothetical protein
MILRAALRLTQTTYFWLFSGKERGSDAIFHAFGGGPSSVSDPLLVFGGKRGGAFGRLFFPSLLKGWQAEMRGSSGERFRTFRHHPNRVFSVFGASLALTKGMSVI